MTEYAAGTILMLGQGNGPPHPATVVNDAAPVPVKMIGNLPLPTDAATAVLQADAIAALDAIGAAVGAPTDDPYVSGSGALVALAKAILGKLGSVVLGAGSAIIGKVGVDQTAPGVTNAMVAGTIDSTGGMCFPDRYDQVLTYNGDGTLATVTFTDGSNAWTQSITYTGGLATRISRWVKS